VGSLYNRLNEDIYQVVVYAEVNDCTEAILIHPAPLDVALDQRLGKIRVRSLAFSIDGDLEQAGQASVRALCAALGLRAQT
jgi:5-methylcytosine-specific restriction enzyme subunit McrC